MASKKVVKRAKKLSTSTTVSSSSRASSAVTCTSSIKDHLLPKMDATSKAKLEQAIAMHYYLTTSSFQQIEEENLAIALKTLRTDDVVLPSRKKLAGPLLEKAYTDLTKR